MQRKQYMPAAVPYFSSESLREQFVQDIHYAAGKALINREEAQWLLLLVASDADSDTDTDTNLPRADRLVLSNGLAGNAELAGALLISDSDNSDTAVFLSTLAFGIERFASRTTLLDALQQRFYEVSASSIVEVERVDGPLFDACTVAVLGQQVHYLDELWTRLEELPDLRAASGKALQTLLSAEGQGDGIEVFSQIVQILETEPVANPGPPAIAGTQYLADAAVQTVISGPLPAGLARRFLDAQGLTLSQARSGLFEQALSDTASGVGTAYEQLLSDYWAFPGADGRTAKDFATHVLAESFRQHLLSSRVSGKMPEAEYQLLLTLLPSCPDAFDPQSIMVRRLSVFVPGQEPVKLVGVVLIEFPGDESAGTYLYSSQPGFLRVTDSDKAIEQILSDRSRAGLLFYSSLNDHAAIQMQGHLELRQDTLTSEFFSDFVESVIALQKRNLRYALALPAIQDEKMTFRIDDALDIRGLLDSRLFRLHDSGRWRSERLTWGASVQGSNAQPDLIIEPSSNWIDKLRKLDAMLERVDALHAGVDGCMRLALNRYLAVIGGPHLDAWALWVVPDDEGARPVRLLSLALDLVCGHAQTSLSGGLVLAGLGTPVLDLPVQRMSSGLIEQILVCVQMEFARRFEKQISEFYSRSIRHLDTRLAPGVITGLVREYSLRLEMLAEKRTAKLPALVIENVLQVLDRPLPALRETLGEACVDAFAVSVRYDPDSPAIKIPNAFVINDRRAHSQPALWVMNRGLVSFATRQALDEYVAALLIRSGLVSHMSGVLAEPDRQTLLAYRARTGTLDLKVILRGIEGHFIQALQRDEIERQRRTVAELYRQAIAWRVPSELFVNLLGAAERDDRNRQILGYLGVAIQFIIYRAIVPTWISDASKADQITLVHALQRFYVTCAAQKDFLFDVPSLYEYSCKQLTLRFNTDFTEPRPDPENILATLTHYVPVPVAPGQIPQAIPAATQAVSENLVEFAINRFLARQDGVILLSSRDHKPLNASLTPVYVRELVTSLDIAAGYRAMLESLLTVTSADYLERRKLFVEQVPSLDILRAFALKLKGELSGQAYRLIENVLGMPDAIARLPVDGCKMVLSALKLLPAKEGWEPTVVLNTYLMGPLDSQPGPWVLYAPLHDAFAFKEYPDQSALLHDIHTSASLQTYILDRVDPGLRKLYDNGGFVEPHLPFSAESSFDLPFETPAPVTLQIDPYGGNCLLLMFEGALNILKLQVKQSSITNAEHRSAASRYLFTLGAEQVMALMPGRLGTLIGIVQGQALLNLSVISAGDQRWGKALSEFMAALSVMISSGQASSIIPSRAVDEAGYWLEDAAFSDPLVQPDDAADVPEFSWSNSSLTQQIRERLRQFEIHDIALNTLQKDELLNTYRDPVTGSTYAAIGGKTYELRFDGDGWFIVSRERVGPPVSLDKDQQWTLDIQGGLKGGGGALTHMEGSLVDDLVNEIIVVSARGMPEIRRSYREMAQSIEDAHAQAQCYLENCLANLTRPLPEVEVEPRAEKILAEFFGQKKPDDRLYEVTRKAVTDIYQELMTPSLSPIDSSRYVVGFNRAGNEASSAFIFEADPWKRVFLTEQFFRLPTYRFKLSAIRSGEFKHGPHYRAAILIHELSHMVLKTDDIAYVDSQAPFVDLIEDTSTYRMRIKNELIFQQQRTLSYLTDRDKLFRQLDEDTWRDLKRADGNEKQTILRVSGKRTLDEARDVFYENVHKRVDIMLKNADSVALLVTLLGRERFVRR
ncbi:hypothetical protein ALQ80_04632 [Pseudomonas coronafaciens pv. oryzae]|nr:Uncharacterized protein ALO38_05104 [Pseudomonas coronafaciens pv. zizaniae]RMM32149.1 hypothetical protein ALQ80_04632 [Pseudomonas coronafaciens pv. oryzae]